MHRFTWDMHYDVIPGAGGGGRGGGGGANGAVPHRTYPGVNSPWVAPGDYVVRLSSNGHAATQPITIKMDPRVKITPEIQQIFTLTAQMENSARTAQAAYQEARAMMDTAKSNPALLKKLEEIAPAQAPPSGGGGGRGGFGAPEEPAPAPTLANIAGQLVSAAMPMQSAEMAPTAAQLEGCQKQQAAYTSLMAKWTAIKTSAK
jgi:hypothetical protein